MVGRRLLSPVVGGAPWLHNRHCWRREETRTSLVRGTTTMSVDMTQSRTKTKTRTRTTVPSGE